jgi:hypothetical protein
MRRALSGGNGFDKRQNNNLLAPEILNLYKKIAFTGARKIAA